MTPAKKSKLQKMLSGAFFFANADNIYNFHKYNKTENYYGSSVSIIELNQKKFED